MTVSEFINTCIASGYANRKDEKRILKWCEQNSKDCCTPDDFVEIYEFLNCPKYGEDLPFDKWRYMYGGVKTTKHYKY